METAIESVMTWRSKFEIQANGSEMRGVYDYAESRARMVQAASGVDDDLLARELVLDALADTFVGLVTWDPARASLAAHLCCVVRARTDRMVRRSKSFVRLPMDDDEDASAQQLERALTDQAESTIETENDSDVGLARLVVAELRALGAGDERVFQLLDAYERCEFERVDVLSSTGMTEIEYHNARRRLSRLVERLPHSLRSAVVDGLT